MYGSAIVQRLRAHAGLTRAEHAHEHLGEPVRDARRAVRARLRGPVERDLAQLVLPTPV